MGGIEKTRPSQQELEDLGALNWPIWTCDVSRFDWHYGQKETCYVLEGQVTVTAGQEKVQFGPGDLLAFPEGMDCVWDVRAPVKKHYKFG